MDLVHMHEALLQTHRELLESPLDDAEGLDRASCPPHRKHLAQLAMGSASDGLSAAQWRSTLVEGLGAGTVPLIDEAEACMRSSGLWPWQ